MDETIKDNIQSLVDEYHNKQIRINYLEDLLEDLQDKQINDFLNAKFDGISINKRIRTLYAIKFNYEKVEDIRYISFDDYYINTDRIGFNVYDTYENEAIRYVSFTFEQLLDVDSYKENKRISELKRISNEIEKLNAQKLKVDNDING